MLNNLLTSYKNVMSQYIAKGTVNNYCTFIRAIQNSLNSSQIDIVYNWIKPNLNKTQPVNQLVQSFSQHFSNINQIGKYKKSDCASALSSFGKFVFGYYKANEYINIDSSFSENVCRLIAQNALFCTIEVAEKIKNGQIGAKVNTTPRGPQGIVGNEYYSWFCCQFQRAKNGEKRSSIVTIPTGQIDPLGKGQYTLDDNTQANQAIKKAVINGLPTCLQGAYNNFDEYMACHIWDSTCYDYRYHTSVFNIVLIPKAIAGLSDHYPEVKELLQYEASHRFGVYPKNCNKPSCPKCYSKLEGFWRQPEEHATTTKNKVLRGI